MISTDVTLSFTPKGFVDVRKATRDATAAITRTHERITTLFSRPKTQGGDDEDAENPD
jgi:hypothetical protein